VGTILGDRIIAKNNNAIRSVSSNNLRTENLNSSKILWRRDRNFENPRFKIKPPLFLAIYVALWSAIFVATICAANDPLSDIDLNFVRATGEPQPVGWRTNSPEDVSLDSKVIRSGKLSVRIERAAGSIDAFSTITKSIPILFEGRKIELRGFIKTANVDGFAGLWMREDGVADQLEFNNMQESHLNGTTDWTQYTVTLPLNPAARSLYLGFLVSGNGTAWVSDLQLFIDGKPASEASRVVRALTILDKDHEFDKGSNITLHNISATQVSNLAALSRVWGFLKYHHPIVTSGDLQWDFELFRVMPQVLSAIDRDGANKVMLRWVEGLGETKPVIHTPPDELDVDLNSDLSWINKAQLGSELCGRLRAIYLSRPANGAQFYVAEGRNVANPIFEHELDYSWIKFPDSGYQLLGLFRFWNIIRYWSPYRNLVGENWDRVLTDYIPRIAIANDAHDYRLEMLALVAEVNDSHANLWDSLDVRPPEGDATLPAIIRFVGDHAVVTNVVSLTSANDTGLVRGDSIDAIGGVATSDLVAKWSPYYAASNEASRLRDLAEFMGRGPSGPVRLKIQRGMKHLDVDVPRVKELKLDYAYRRHELPGSTFRLLSNDVAYLKLSSVRVDDCVSYIDRAGGTKGLIIDARNYPSEFVVFALGSHLVDKPTEFVRFTVGILSDPGEFSYTRPLTIQPKAPHYAGKVVVLVDEITQSQAEYTAMAFRAAPETIVVGSKTAGADGNVSRIPLPGGLHTMISGIGVFYPDKRPTQCIGILPDVEAKATIAGIRSGRDEVLEEGLRQILGAQIPTEDIIRMTVVQ